MLVKSNGISAERLREEDIELVRNWRNSSFNLQHMNYQKYISKAEQKEWFKQVDNFNNFYFIIYHKGIKTGVANIKNIDWNKRTGEVGVLISDQKKLGNSTNLLMALTMCDFGFKNLGINTVSSKVKTENLRAQKFNHALGFKTTKKNISAKYQLYTLTKESFYNSTKKYFLFWTPMSLFDDNIIISYNTHDYLSGLKKKMDEIQTPNPIKLNQRKICITENQ